MTTNPLEMDEVPCVYCGDLTTYIGTKHCDRCHEVAVRVRRMPVAVLQAILDDNTHDVWRRVEEYEG